MVVLHGSLVKTSFAYHCFFCLCFRMVASPDISPALYIQTYTNGNNNYYSINIHLIKEKNFSTQAADTPNLK